MGRYIEKNRKHNNRRTHWTSYSVLIAREGGNVGIGLVAAERDNGRDRGLGQ